MSRDALLVHLEDLQLAAEETATPAACRSSTRSG